MSNDSKPSEQGGFAAATGSATCKCLNQYWSIHCIQCGKPFSVARIEDLAMLVRRLCYVIHVYDKGKDNTVAQKALDYLKRHGVEGSVLREPPNSEVRGGAPLSNENTAEAPRRPLH